mgnify:CR=1 FL=1
MIYSNDIQVLQNNLLLLKYVWTMVKSQTKISVHTLYSRFVSGHNLNPLATKTIDIV